MTWTSHGRPGQSLLLAIGSSCPDGYSWEFDNLAIPRECIKLKSSQIQRRGPVCAGAEVRSARSRSRRLILAAAVPRCN